MKGFKPYFLSTLLIVGMSLFLTQCKKEKEIVEVHDIVYIDPNDTGVYVPSNAIIDTSWVFDKVHCSTMWESKYYDFSSTMLTGRFNNFNFSPKFNFDETNLSKNSINYWVQLSTFNTGEPGRDGLGKCGPSYLGNVYLDSLKTMVNPASDTAWFHLTKTTRTNKGYDLEGTFTFNRYRTPSGYPDGTPITKTITAKMTYNGQADFDTNNDGTPDKLRCGFTTTFSFKRSDFMDIASTKAWDPFDPNNAATVNNKTYGVYSHSTADQMDIRVNSVFYKNH